jgi:hypothetical protein
MTGLWDVVPCSLIEVDRRFRGAISIMRAMNILIALMMKAVYTSETSVYLYETTRRYTSEGCLLQISFCFTV